MSDFKLPDRLFGFPVIVDPNMKEFLKGDIILGKPFSGVIPLHDDGESLLPKDCCSYCGYSFGMDLFTLPDKFECPRCRSEETRESLITSSDDCCWDQ